MCRITFFGGITWVISNDSRGITQVISNELLGNVSDFKPSRRALNRLKMRLRASKERLESVCRASLKRLERLKSNLWGIFQQFYSVV